MVTRSVDIYGEYICWFVPLLKVGLPVQDNAEVRLQDDLALNEIELYSELVIAASSSDRPLSRDEIDTVLRVDEPGD